MNTPGIVPQNAPREFRLDEMFFSTTDRRGVIALGNAVFVRVSGYPAERLIGSPHNVIRHPDMPRAAFRLVWKHLLADEPVVAYVKNLAADGCYYWVVALITPIAGGFLSIRFKPTSPLHAVVEEIYARMREAEAAQCDQPDGGRLGMDAADRILAESLARHGFADYEAFMRAMLHTELKSREEALAREHRQVITPWPEKAGNESGALAACLHAVHHGGRLAYGQINRLYGRLDEFAAMNEELENKARFVLGLTREFRFISINAALESTKLGEEGNGLGVIAGYLGDMSQQISRTVEGLTARIHGVLAKLRAIIFHFATARLQIEMTLIFCRESLDEILAAAGDADAVVVASHRSMIERLQAAFRATTQRSVGELGSLERDLLELDHHSQDLHRTVTALQVAHVSGLIEANHLKDEAAFAGMFAEVRKQIDHTRDELGELDTIIERLGTLAREAPAIAAVITGAVEQMDRDVRGLTASADGAVAEAPSKSPLRDGMVASARPASGRNRTKPTPN